MVLHNRRIFTDFGKMTKYFCVYHDNSRLLVTFYLVESCFLMYIRYSALARNCLGRISEDFANIVIIFCQIAHQSILVTGKLAAFDDYISNIEVLHHSYVY